MGDTKPRILVVDDERANITALGVILSDEFAVSVALSGEQALKVVASATSRPDLILLDVLMPGLDGYATCRQLKAEAASADIPVIFVSALEHLQGKVEGFRAGAVDYLTKPPEPEEVLARVRAHLTLRQQMIELEDKNRELETLYRQLLEETEQRQQAEANYRAVDAKLSALSAREAQKWGLSAFVGQSPGILRLQDDIRKLQTADRTSVLVLGESGTGKELVARALHFGSGRSKNAFVPVNCSAIPAELADATFFGSVKGAYTGSVGDRKGYFEEADGGTLFLDEIGDMPMMLQVKLLRVLEESKITPVGGVKERSIDVRVVAATNVDLAEQIAQKTFRRDLYFRLAGYTLRIPPLRERPGDVELLARHFANQYATEMGLNPVSLGADAIKALAEYSFPGNVRELRNLMEFALIRSGGGTITAEHLHFLSPLEEEIPPAVAAPTPVPAPAPPLGSLPAAPAPAPNQAETPVAPGPLLEIPDLGPSEQLILNYLDQHARINNRQCQQLLNVDHSRASYLLKKLHREGRLRKRGERRWAYYERA